jgi:hypothetical protein
VTRLAVILAVLSREGAKEKKILQTCDLGGIRPREASRSSWLRASL